MNKLLKGAVAGAAGLTLLLGGAGTYAFWNDSVAINDATVTAGTLKLTPTTAGTWSAKVGTSTFLDINLATFKIVPGTVLTYKRDVGILASGGGLTAALAIDTGTITAAGTDALASNALRDDLIKGATITVVGAPANPTPPGTGVIVSGAGTQSALVTTFGQPGNTVAATVKVGVTFTFPNKQDDPTTPTVNEGDQNASKNGVVDLSQLGITLTQSAPVTP